MKRILFLFGLLVCLAGMPLTAFADNKTAKQTYETAISDNWKTMLKNSIALDTINAENNTHLLKLAGCKEPVGRGGKACGEDPEAPGRAGRGSGEHGPVHKGEEDL